jgi:hypothetical protein
MRGIYEYISTKQSVIVVIGVLAVIFAMLAFWLSGLFNIRLDGKPKDYGELGRIYLAATRNQNEKRIAALMCPDREKYEDEISSHISRFHQDRLVDVTLDFSREVGLQNRVNAIRIKGMTTRGIKFEDKIPIEEYALDYWCIKMGDRKIDM